MEGLPEGCVATILAHTTPKDACRLSLVSKIFRSAAESDAAWERFLPPNYNSQDFVPLHYTSKKFPKVAQLKGTCWLEIRGVINTRALSPNTQYVAYLVYKMIDAHGFRYCPVKLSVNFLGFSTKNVCLDPNREAQTTESWDCNFQIREVMGGWRLRWGSSSIQA
ncbi:hypothetical protein Fmac_024345 [Flemingia macrophylla]|uniref:F-box domain-containing protein n=1 Tax=Flemingia macrophylla TaxID=520843 RepID=A0ABD1LP35_9FABA